MQILNGAIVHYEGIWPNVFHLGQSAGDVIAAVTSKLSRDGLAVRSSSNDYGILGAFKSQYTQTLDLQVNNGLGYGSEDDIISIIRHEFYQVLNDFPISDSITTVKQPTGVNGGGASANVPIPTGQPPQQSQQSSSTPSFFDSLKQLGSNTTFTLAGLGIGLIVAVLLIAQPSTLAVRRAR